MLADLRYRLRAIFRRRTMEQELETELQLHHEREAAKLVGRGLPPPAARRHASWALGGIEQVKEETRDTWGVGFLDSGIRDVRYALRLLRRNASFTACAVAVLAISTGASTAVFTTLDATVFKPLPVANADRLVRLQVLPDGATTGRRDPTYAAIEPLQRLTRSLEHLAAEARAGVPLGLDAAPPVDTTPARAIYVTGNYFSTLGVHARVGRTLQPSDDGPSADHGVAVGTYRFWRDRYGLDANAIGSTVHVRSRPFRIVGFLPETFEGIRKGTLVADVYVPMSAAAEILPGLWGPHAPVQAIGLLRRDTSRNQVSAELESLSNNLEAVDGRLVLSDASRGISAIDDDEETSLYLAASAVALIVLIGCLNVSCLLAVQGAARRNEIALRRALGATAQAILRQSIVENGLLAVAGGVCGLALAPLGARAILSWLHRGTQPIDLSVDARVLSFSLAVVLVTGVISGLLPVLDALRTRHLEIYRDARLRPFTSGKVLIVVEVALSLVLVAGAGMFLRGIDNLQSFPLGFNARDVAVVTLWPHYDDFPDGADRERYMAAEASRLRERLAQMRETAEATVGPVRPFSGGTDYVVSRTAVPADGFVTASGVHVDDRYFDVFEIPVVAGRAFSDRDNDSSARVVILSRSSAERLFGDASPLGQQVALGATTATVVGVVGDIHRRSLKQAPVSMVYLPLWQRPAGRGWPGEVNVHVRTRQPPGDVSALIERELMAGRYALRRSPADPTTLEATIGASYVDDTIRMQVTALLAAIAVALVIVGVYGLTSYAVTRRAHEIGVRMAIGATPTRILGLIFKESGSLFAAGVLVGVPGALVVMRALSSYTFQVSSLDPSTIGGAVVVMVLAAGIAAARPVWRATHVDPVETLRAS